MDNMDNISILRTMVRGAYDLQQLRMQTGLRLVANFRAKLALSGVVEDEEEPEDHTLTEEEWEEEEEKANQKKEAESGIKMLKKSFKRLTDGIASEVSEGPMKLPRTGKFVGDRIISTHTELTLVSQYLELERQEARQFRQLENVLKHIPIYTDYLADQVGVGPAMAGVLIAYLDPAKATYISSFWKYSGLDVANGQGRSRRAEHLVEREYKNREGKTATRLGVTFNPFLKTKLTGVLAGSFLRSNSPWRKVYDEYKHRIQTSGNMRPKVTVTEWKKIYKKDPDRARQLWTPGRIDAASKRYMVKMFLADLWVNWRKMEGLPVSQPYAVAVQGKAPHSRPQPSKSARKRERVA